jgi:uncharacterized protein (DUF1697 family)
VALVVFLRGVNVGGHRTFRPAALARDLEHLGAVNIGAAGTFVIRRPVTRARLRAELAKRLPFETVVAICDGRDITKLVASRPFGVKPAPAGVVRFVSVVTGSTRGVPSKPVRLPASGQWLVRVIGRHKQFILGEYRRNLKTIGYLGTLDKSFRGRVTTRNWNTITRILSEIQRPPSAASS